MNIPSLKQLTEFKSPNRPQKLINLNTPQYQKKKPATLKDIKIEKCFKGQSTTSLRVPKSFREINITPQASESQNLVISKKFESLLGQIDSVIKVETNTTRQLQGQIDKKISKISQHFENKSTTSKSKNEMDKVMFSNKEKENVINLYNNSINTHYTNTASGIVYFKKNILQKDQEFGF